MIYSKHIKGATMRLYEGLCFPVCVRNMHPHTRLSWNKEGLPLSLHMHSLPKADICQPTNVSWQNMLWITIAWDWETEREGEREGESEAEKRESTHLCHSLSPRAIKELKKKKTVISNWWGLLQQIAVWLKIYVNSWLEMIYLFQQRLWDH